MLRLYICCLFWSLSNSSSNQELYIPGEFMRGNDGGIENMKCRTEWPVVKDEGGQPSLRLCYYDLPLRDALLTPKADK